MCYSIAQPNSSVLAQAPAFVYSCKDPYMAAGVGRSPRWCWFGAVRSGPRSPLTATKLTYNQRRSAEITWAPESSLACWCGWLPDLAVGIGDAAWAASKLEKSSRMTLLELQLAQLLIGPDITLNTEQDTCLGYQP